MHIELLIKKGKDVVYLDYKIAFNSVATIPEVIM